MAAMFKKPKIPKAAEPKVIPMAQPEKVEQERQRTITKARQRGGRASTMLSSGDTLG